MAESQKSNIFVSNKALRDHVFYLFYSTYKLLVQSSQIHFRQTQEQILLDHKIMVICLIFEQIKSAKIENLFFTRHFIMYFKLTLQNNF